MKEIEDEIKYAVRRQEESIYRRKLRLKTPEMERFQSLILYNLNTAEAVLTDNNDIRIFTDGREKFDALMEEMKGAKNYIHLQYYIIRDDEAFGRNRGDTVKKRRQRAWEVRVLFDIGMAENAGKSLETAGKGGVEVPSFSGVSGTVPVSGQLP